MVREARPVKPRTPGPADADRAYALPGKHPRYWDGIGRTVYHAETKKLPGALTMRILFVIPLLCLAFDTFAKSSQDYAENANRAAWLSHPIYGEASFDAFEHAAANPLHRGTTPYTWPVNGFLFKDPVSKQLYVYVGHYLTNYAFKDEYPSRCTVFRSEDDGKTWKEIGPVFSESPFYFTDEVSPLFHAPDVAVIYSDGRYHMSFDWTTKNTTWENAANPAPDTNSGVGYAWSESPEGPFHIEPRPIASTRNQVLLEGRYRRLYASSIHKRANDWLVLTLTDSGKYFGWALLGMTAPAPEGPYSEPKLLLHPESDQYHPSLLEFFPAFVHGDTLYASATSVALNRNVQAMFTVPLENALEPAAWKLAQLGSLWHAAPVEHEWFGIWGQAFSGMVDGERFRVMYPSRDKSGNGTINLAERPWAKPFTDSGFVVSAHEGASFAVLRHAGPARRLAVEWESVADLFQSAELVWDMQSPLNPKPVSSNASLDPSCSWHDTSLRMTATQWALVERRNGVERQISGGPRTWSDATHCELAWTDAGVGTLTLNGEHVWSGELSNGPGILGLRLSPHTWMRVKKFEVTGGSDRPVVTYGWAEAVLAATQEFALWQPVQSEQFRFGQGLVSGPGCSMAKWNVEGARVQIWAPRGPQYGQADVFVDGSKVGTLACHADGKTPSAAIATYNLTPGPHAIVLRNFEGAVPLDSVDVSGR